MERGATDRNRLRRFHPHTKSKTSRIIKVKRGGFAACVSSENRKPEIVKRNLKIKKQTKSRNRKLEKRRQLCPCLNKSAQGVCQFPGLMPSATDGSLYRG